jgi:hypothetical protein
MSAFVKLLAIALALGFGCSSAVAASHPVPKERTALANRDWLPHVVSKIAPLEWWNFANSSTEIRRDDYQSDYRFDLAKQDTLFPRFCFALFRPKPEMRSALMAAVNAYKGEVIWTIDEDCISAMPGTPGGTRLSAMPMMPEQRERFREEHKLLPFVPLKADAEFVKRALGDAVRLAVYIEDRLGLAGKPSLDFDPQWLSREGLAASRGQFDDYWEPGAWSAFLARKPQQYAGKFEPTSVNDRPLAFGIAAYEMDALFDELSPGWEAFQGEEGPVISAYPLLSRLSDMTVDALYDRNEVDALLDECVQTQARVKAPYAIRGLDNLVRIARWAQKLKVGIYFGAENP